jgi:hypothetical protein
MKNIFFHRAIMYQMFMNNSSNYYLVNVVVPDAFRVYHDNRTGGADTKTRRRAPLDSVRILVIP